MEFLKLGVIRIKLFFSSDTSKDIHSPVILLYCLVVQLLYSRKSSVYRIPSPSHIRNLLFRILVLAENRNSPVAFLMPYNQIKNKSVG